MVLISALSALLFMGGWLSPLPSSWVDGIFLLDDGFHWLLLKTFFFMFLFLWFRATFPRYRYDQIMRLGWKVFIPITIAWILVVGLAVVYQMPPWWSA
jgi:NADH-quinone oxidoreductase subunit H